MLRSSYATIQLNSLRATVNYVFHLDRPPKDIPANFTDYAIRKEMAVLLKSRDPWYREGPQHTNDDQDIFGRELDELRLGLKVQTACKEALKRKTAARVRLSQLDEGLIPASPNGSDVLTDCIETLIASLAINFPDCKTGRHANHDHLWVDTDGRPKPELSRGLGGKFFG